MTQGNGLIPQWHPQRPPERPKPKRKERSPYSGSHRPDRKTLCAENRRSLGIPSPAALVSTHLLGNAIRLGCSGRSPSTFCRESPLWRYGLGAGHLGVVEPANFVGKNIYRDTNAPAVRQGQWSELRAAAAGALEER